MGTATRDQERAVSIRSAVKVCRRRRLVCGQGQAEDHLPGGLAPTARREPSATWQLRHGGSGRPGDGNDAGPGVEWMARSRPEVATAAISSPRSQRRDENGSRPFNEGASSPHGNERKTAVEADLHGTEEAEKGACDGLHPSPPRSLQKAGYGTKTVNTCPMREVPAQLADACEGQGTSNSFSVFLETSYSR